MAARKKRAGDVAGPTAGLFGFAIVILILLVLVLGGLGQTLFFINTTFGRCNAAESQSLSLKIECRDGCITDYADAAQRRRCFSGCETEFVDRGLEVLSCHGNH